MKSIEQRIYEKMMNNISESMNFNQSISQMIAKSIEGINLEYKGFLTTPSESVNIPIIISMILDENDIETVESDKVVYVYLKAKNLNFKVRSYSPEGDDTVYSDFINSSAVDTLINNLNSWIVHNSKCWKDSNSLYLLKMNRTTGIVSRYDRHTNTFRRQDSINYLNALDYDIAKTLLTREYLEDYISSQLCLIKSTLDYGNPVDLENKHKSEIPYICRVV